MVSREGYSFKQCICCLHLYPFKGERKSFLPPLPLHLSPPSWPLAEVESMLCTGREENFHLPSSSSFSYSCLWTQNIHRMNFDIRASDDRYIILIGSHVAVSAWCCGEWEQGSEVTCSPWPQQIELWFPWQLGVANGTACRRREGKGWMSHTRTQRFAGWHGLRFWWWVARCQRIPVYHKSWGLWAIVLCIPMEDVSNMSGIIIMRLYTFGFHIKQKKMDESQFKLSFVINREIW